MPEVIADGQTRRVRIMGLTKTGHQLHEPFEFEYRPLTGPQRQQLIAENAFSKDLGAKRTAEDLAKRVMWWDFTENGEPLEITAANVNRLQDNYYDVLRNVAMGMAAPDYELIDGDWVANAVGDAELEAEQVPN